MEKYSITLSTRIPHNTIIDVYELCKGGKSLFEEFFIQIEKEGQQTSDLYKAIRIIEDTSNLQLRPKTKFRRLHEIFAPFKVYEAKSGGIRIYLLHEENNGRVILMGGKKDNQKIDFKKIKKILKEYHNENKHRKNP